MEPRHQSVLPAECLRLLDPLPGETWVDATCGGGGHSRLIAEAIGPTGRLIALDQDETMLALAAPIFVLQVYDRVLSSDVRYRFVIDTATI